jgi:uncharacterized protein (DUF2461 family)
MAFSGWSVEAVEFFKTLQADNTKTYWNSHKALYEMSVREPMVELLGELSGEFGPMADLPALPGHPVRAA